MCPIVMWCVRQVEEMEGAIGPFLLSSEFAKDDEEVTSLCQKLAEALTELRGGKSGPRLP